MKYDENGFPVTEGTSYHEAEDPHMDPAECAPSVENDSGDGFEDGTAFPANAPAQAPEEGSFSPSGSDIGNTGAGSAPEGSFGQDHSGYGADASEGSYVQGTDGLGNAPEGSFGQDHSGYGTDSPEGSYGQGTEGFGNSSEGYFGQGQGGPGNAPEGSDASGAGSEENGGEDPLAGKRHDFDVEEPKFDTQTGEPLNKPKKKYPAIILTAAVTVLTVGAFVYAVDSSHFSSGSSMKDNDLTETEVRLAIAAESETESYGMETETSETGMTEMEAVPSSMTGGGKEDAGETEQTEAMPPDTEQTEATAADAEQIMRAPAEAGETESEETEAEETESEGSLEETLLKLADGSRSQSGDQTDKSGTDSQDPVFKTEGVLLRASIDVSDLVEEVLPGIVSVTSVNMETARQIVEGTEQIPQDGAGSGIIFREDEETLYIVTDANITGDETDVTVGFWVSGDKARDLEATDRMAPASVLGADEESSIAVLAVDRGDVNATVLEMVSPADLGDSDEVRVGERTLAAGNALGYGASVTEGIISATDRKMMTASGTRVFLQTDASINYGNYGGALVNIDGEVIGINAGKITQDQIEGMGYACPVNDMKEAAGRILSESGSDKGEVSEEKKDEKKDEEKEDDGRIKLAIASEQKDGSDDGETEAQEGSGGAGEDAGKDAKADAGKDAKESAEEDAGKDAEESAGEDAGKDAEESAGEDAGKDAEESAGEDAGKDAEEDAGSKEDSQKKAQESEKESVISADTSGEADTEQSDDGNKNDETRAEDSERKGVMGIQVGELTDEDRIIYRIPKGVIVAVVQEDSGARKAGISERDLIVSVEGQKTETVEQLQEVLSSFKAGDKIKVEYIRPDEDGDYDEENVTAVIVKLQ